MESLLKTVKIKEEFYWTIYNTYFLTRELSNNELFISLRLGPCYFPLFDLFIVHINAMRSIDTLSSM